MRAATRLRVGMGPARASASTGDAVPIRSVSKRLNAANAPPQVTSRRVGSTHRKRLGRDKFLQLDASDALARIEALLPLIMHNYAPTMLRIYATRKPFKINAALLNNSKQTVRTRPASVAARRSMTMSDNTRA